MYMFKYVVKRVALMIITFFVIMLICFTLIKLLQPEAPMMGNQAQLEAARREALGYNKPIMVQFGIYLNNVLTKGDWGTSWKIDYMSNVSTVVASRLPPTVILNALSLLFSLPLGIALGIYAALKKNRWQDHLISTLIMVFISVPSFVYAYLVQYTLGFRLGWFPVVISSIYDAGGSWLTGKMLYSMVLPVLALSFGTIADLARFVRAELTEALTSDYMLLARTKGLTKRQATVRHALKNSMVPILPTIIGMIVGILGGSMIIESIFAINGIGKLYIQSLGALDYDLFIGVSMFYTAVTLSSIIVIDLSYGFLDPRVRMGAK